jgi:hypothetical protein
MLMFEVLKFGLKKPSGKFKPPKEVYNEAEAPSLIKYFRIT